MLEHLLVNMNHKRISPIPLFDSLKETSNPFKQTNFTIKSFALDSKPPAGAKTDFEHALKFLYSYNGSPATYNAYRRELERFLQWAWWIESRSILTLKREDIEEYVWFCLNPPKAWLGVKTVPRFINKSGQRIPNADWRPFVASVSKNRFRSGHKPEKDYYVMSQASIKAIFTALSSFYDYLAQEKLTDSNPVALIRQKSKFIRKDQNKAPVRRISSLQWEYVIETAEIMAIDHPDIHERTLFIMNCLFAMYLRISEIVTDERSIPTMSDFKKDHDGNWWFHVIGKGNKSRTVTVSSDMLKALKRYRKSLGLTALPSPDENTPLITKQRGKGAITSTRYIREIVQNCFDAAYQRMKTDGLEDDATDLRAATVHWLRHTGISEDVKIRPREHVRDDAGHSSMQTTDRYIESDDRERHASGKRKKIKDL